MNKRVGGKSKLLYAFVFVYLLVFGFMALTRFFGFIEMSMFDRDRYLQHLVNFKDESFYELIAFGTSVFFNAFIYLFNFFYNDLALSFKVLSIVSVLLLGYIGGVIVYKNKNDQKWLTLLFVPLFALFWLNDEQVQWTNNDIFLSVIVLLIYAVLFAFKNLKKKALILGVIFGLLFSTRLLFSIVLIPSFIYCFIVFCKNNSVNYKNILIFSSFFLVTMLLFHFPSLIENGKLSTYVKGGDYGSYNTVGTLRMFDENRVQLIRKEIYVESSSTEFVENYKIEHNIKNLPRGAFQFMIEYPLYYLKLVALNYINIFIFFFRRYSLLLVFPIIAMVLRFKKEKLKLWYHKEQLPFFMFIIFCFTLMTVLVTVIEFRWLDTIEFLLLFSIYKSIQYLYTIKYKVKLLNTLMIVSLSILIIFNLRTIIYMIS